jgi:nitrite reductase/ring-hydroxylating ferredoxin subunit
MNIHKHLLLFVLLAGLSGCDGYVSSIPDMEVYLKRNLTTEKLNTFGAYLYVTEPVLAIDRIGFGGLLIVHAQDNIFYAVDLACPHEVDPDVRISPPDVMGICKCPTCGEEYDMSYGMGTPRKGISKETLKHYNVSFDDNDYIIVTR